MYHSSAVCFYLSWLVFSYKLVKLLSVCVCVDVCPDVEEIVKPLTRFLQCEQGSLVGLCVQDYKSLCAAAMIRVSLVNIQTDTHRQHLNSLYVKLSQLS